MTKTQINIAELERLAKEATPKNGAVSWYDLNRLNLAANPSTVLALCEVVRAAMRVSVGIGHDEMCPAINPKGRCKCGRNALLAALANVEVGDG